MSNESRFQCRFLGGDRPSTKAALPTKLAATLIGITLFGNACDSELPSLEKLSSPLPSVMLEVRTYNTGMLQYGTFDLVPCVRQRLNPQIFEFFQTQSEQAKLNRRHSHLPSQYVFLLQEVWTEEAYFAYSKQAKSLSWSVAPASYEEIRHHGQMTITNGQLLSYRLLPFSRDQYARRGILETEIQFPNRHLLAANVHTTFSDRQRPSPVHLQQLDEISRRIRQYGTTGFRVLGGDFNAGEDMSFQNESYPSAVTLWQGPIVGRLPHGWQISDLPSHQVTWSRELNPLVFQPAALISWALGGQVGHWGEESSTLDHILSSPTLTLRDTHRIMDRKVNVSQCPRYTQGGKSFASDHFGVAVRYSW